MTFPRERERCHEGRSPKPRMLIAFSAASGVVTATRREGLPGEPSVRSGAKAVLCFDVTIAEPRSCHASAAESDPVTRLRRLPSRRIVCWAAARRSVARAAPRGADVLCEIEEELERGAELDHGVRLLQV